MGIGLVKSLLTLLFIGAFAGTSRAQHHAEGKGLYTSYCSACHGDTGKGDGMAAKGLPAKPADHTNGSMMNQLSEKYLLEIISKGGSAVGKSGFMPAWGSSLNEKQIRDIVAYIRSIAVPAFKADAKANK
jgi:mono/diheme cytochrome c family protein